MNTGNQQAAAVRLTFAGPSSLLLHCALGAAEASDSIGVGNREKTQAFTCPPNRGRPSDSFAHVHLYHEQPQCAANWYVAHLSMELPPVRNDDTGVESPRAPYDPCAAEYGEPSWPSTEPGGTIRQPRGTVRHGNGSISWYPRQCVDGRCGEDRPLVASRGQVLDHVAFTVADLDAWLARLRREGVTILEEPRRFGESRAFMIEGPDQLAIELVEAGGVPVPPSPTP